MGVLIFFFENSESNGKFVIFSQTIEWKKGILHGLGISTKLEVFAKEDIYFEWISYMKKKF